MEENQNSKAPNKKQVEGVENEGAVREPPWNREVEGVEGGKNSRRKIFRPYTCCLFSLAPRPSPLAPSSLLFNFIPFLTGDDVNIPLREGNLDTGRAESAENREIDI